MANNLNKVWAAAATFAKHVRVPGMDLTLGDLVEFKDRVADDQDQEKVKKALDAILEHQEELSTAIREAGETVTDEELEDAAVAMAEEAYLRRVAAKYLYSDFKGIEQLEKLVPLKLDEVFVDLRVRRERAVADRHDREADMLDRVLVGSGEERDLAEQRLAELDVLKLRGGKGAEPESIDQVLKEPGGAVLLGGPGSGKTTLVKRLARSLALGADVAAERYPAMPWCLPFVLPVAVFDDRGADGDVLDLVRQRLDDLGGRALVVAFDRRWAEGECLVLLDGLDEVAEVGRRIHCSRAAGELVRDAGRNRVVVTSRPVGYSICRLSVPAEHVVLEPFGSGEIETFVRQWHLAYDRAVHSESPRPDAAKVAAEELIEDIRDSPRVESLASNPLMLTIIALIKQQAVVLPERRVELYEIALNTLIRSWNKARSLSDRPVGQDLRAEETKKIWAAVAFWMHKERTTGTVTRQQLQRKLVGVLEDLDFGELEAETTAESYIEAAAERAGLLEERGANVFAFMHQTFQEYLAARHLWLRRPRKDAISRVLEVAGDPRWHEVVRLTAGFVGVIQEDDEIVTDLVEAIIDHDGGPLEPYLCANLRLAASCIADDVRVSPRTSGEVVVRICERLNQLPYPMIHVAFAEILRAMRTFSPGPRAVEALRRLTEHDAAQSKIEAARMLARVAATDPKAADALRIFFEKSDGRTRAHAALGLWAAGEREQELPEKIVEGLAFHNAKMPKDIDVEGLATALVALLGDQSSNYKARATSVLRRWGHQAEATPVLVSLLGDKNSSVRIRAASVLGQWGQKAEATPVLVSLLGDEDPGVRIRAAEVLGQWGQKAEATPVLVSLLGDGSSYVRIRAAEVLGQWEPQAEATPVLVSLLGDEDPGVRIRAAKVLGQWGQKTEATPALVSLLGDENSYVRIRAAEVLGQWKTDPVAIRNVLEELTEIEESIADYLVSGDAGLPDPQTAAALADILEPREDDPEAIQVRRRIVFDWVWQVSQTSE